MTTQHKHTALPWKIKLQEKYPDCSAEVWAHIETKSSLGGHRLVLKTSDGNAQNDAAFIVRACNNHYKLIRACEMALETIKHAALEEFNIPQKLLEEALKQAKVEE